MRRDREQIIGAARSIASARFHYAGLCWAFSREWSIPDAYQKVPEYLRALGARVHRGDAGFYWPLTDEGKHQRLTFLAFMLAWEEDHANAN